MTAADLKAKVEELTARNTAWRDAANEQAQRHLHEVIGLTAERDRLKAEIARLQTENDSWKLVYDKDSQPFDQELRAALLHVLSAYDGPEHREVLSTFAAKLRATV